GPFIELHPVGLGTYNGHPAVYLASTPRLVDPRGDVLPIPVSEPAAKVLEDAMSAEEMPKIRVIAACMELVNRDGDLYDTLPWSWGLSGMAKRDAFSRLSQG
ncbi:unnamed protein product, partial [Phaeothamnion confervicola]